MLKQTEQGWLFRTEAVLEDFVWANLAALLELTPLKRQYSINGEFCDILALTVDGFLTVIELKNGEDRHVISQITRYYDSLISKRPFGDSVDYSLGIRLIVISPIYHRYNRIERTYHRLAIEFMTIAVRLEGSLFRLHLQDVDSGSVRQIDLPCSPQDLPGPQQSLPNPPKLLVNLLERCSTQSAEGLTHMRERLLTYDRRMEESASSGSIRYGTKRPCAEVRLDPRVGEPVMFLFLPLVKIVKRVGGTDAPLGHERLGRVQGVGRMRIWTDWQTVSALGHFPKGLGETGIEGEFWTDGLDPETYLRKRISHHSRRRGDIDAWELTPDGWLRAPLGYYLSLVGAGESNSLASLLDLALGLWSNKLTTKAKSEPTIPAHPAEWVPYEDDNGNVVEIRTSRYVGIPPSSPPFGRKSAQWVRRAVYRYHIKFEGRDIPTSTVNLRLPKADGSMKRRSKSA